MEVSISSEKNSKTLSDMDAKQNRDQAPAFMKSRTYVSKDSKKPTLIEGALPVSKFECESDIISSKLTHTVNDPICEVKESETESTPPMDRAKPREEKEIDSMQELKKEST